MSPALETSTARGRPLVGANVGGTFTERDPDRRRRRVRVHKAPSTPPDFERAVLQCRRTPVPNASQQAGRGRGCHGTTVATNAVLEHRGAKTALVTTRGLPRRARAPPHPRPADVRPLLRKAPARWSSATSASSSASASPPARCRSGGSRGAGADCPASCESERVESVAVCFLHAYAFPAREARGRLPARHLPACRCRCRRTFCASARSTSDGTTVVNAYVRPVDGALPARAARRPARAGRRGAAADHAVGRRADARRPRRRCGRSTSLESGPAAGVLAAGHRRRRLG